MEEICGYKGLDGCFYETKNECEKSNLEYKVKDVERKLNNFESVLGDYFALNTPGLTHKIFVDNKKFILDMVARKVLQNSDDFIEVINRKKSLRKELDELKRQQDKENTGWNLLEKWWLRNKWW